MNEIKISLAAARVNANLKQSDVADILGKSKNTIISWENGRTIPDFKTVHTLSELYKIPIEYLRVGE